MDEDSSIEDSDKEPSKEEEEKSNRLSAGRRRSSKAERDEKLRASREFRGIMVGGESFSEMVGAFPMTDTEGSSKEDRSSHSGSRRRSPMIRLSDVKGDRSGREFMRGTDVSGSSSDFLAALSKANDTDDSSRRKRSSHSRSRRRSSRPSDDKVKAHQRSSSTRSVSKRGVESVQHTLEERRERDGLLFTSRKQRRSLRLAPATAETSEPFATTATAVENDPESTRNTRRSKKVKPAPNDTDDERVNRLEEQNRAIKRQMREMQEVIANGGTPGNDIGSLRFARRQKRSAIIFAVCVLVFGLITAIIALLLSSNGNKSVTSSIAAEPPSFASISANPSPTPSHEPTMTITHDVPSEKDCERITHQEPIKGQGALLKKTFEILMEVTLANQNISSADWIEVLAQSVMEGLIPDLACCNERNRALSDRSFYDSLEWEDHRELQDNLCIIANANVTGVLEGETECTKNDGNLCYIVSIKLDVFLRGNEQDVNLSLLITEVILADDEIVDFSEKYNLPSDFISGVDLLDTIELNATEAPSGEPIEDPTMVPTESPSAVPSSPPVPTNAPVAGATPNPTTSLSTQPSGPPSSLRRTPAPTSRPTLVPSQNPTLLPTPIETPGPTSANTAGPTPNPSPSPTPVPTILPTPLATPLPTDQPSQLPTLSTPNPSVSPTVMVRNIAPISQDFEGVAGDDFFMTLPVSNAPPGSRVELVLDYSGDIHQLEEYWEVRLGGNPVATLGRCRETDTCVFHDNGSVGAEDHVLASVTAEEFNSAISGGSSIVLHWVNGGEVGSSAGNGDVHRAEVGINYLAPGSAIQAFDHKPYVPIGPIEFLFDVSPAAAGTSVTITVIYDGDIDGNNENESYTVTIGSAAVGGTIDIAFLGNCRSTGTCIECCRRMQARDTKTVVMTAEEFNSYIEASGDIRIDFVNNGAVLEAGGAANLAFVEIEYVFA